MKKENGAKLATIRILIGSSSSDDHAEFPFTKNNNKIWTYAYIHTWRWLLMWAILSPFTRICCKIRFGVASAKPFCCIFICSSQFSDLQKVPSHLNLIFDVSGAHTLTREREERHDTRSKHIYVVFCTQKILIRAMR